MNSQLAPPDGIDAMVAPDRVTPSARKLRDTYACIPGAPFYHQTFGLWMCLEAWQAKDLPSEVDLNEFFLLEEPGVQPLKELGWCEAPFCPAFEEEAIEDRGDHELAIDGAGRKVLYFKGRRQGFMPEYVDHPVKDMRSWETDVKWRLSPDEPTRYVDLPERMASARTAAGRGLMIQQRLIGGYMYLRSLMGPEQVMYAFHDQPELVHSCMRTWLILADHIIARHQDYVTLDELFLAEDICYNHGLLISPTAMREFLFPYYQQLISNIRFRQRDRTRHLYVQVDTDGFAIPAIPLYRDAIDMDVMSPFEVASGCDVVEVVREYPHLIISGGIDKRILAQTPAVIDEYLEKVLPVMRERGGYIPTCDHGVPPEVPWRNFLHYRQRCREYGD